VVYVCKCIIVIFSELGLFVEGNVNVIIVNIVGTDLASVFERVIAYDLASGFVDMAKRLSPPNVTAIEGDAMLIHNEPLVKGQKFNLIVGANLVDRVPDPVEWLKRSTEMLADDGILVIFTPFTWLSEYSDQSKWFGELLIVMHYTFIMCSYFYIFICQVGFEGMRRLCGL
jgi:2-polyprenyl-3-methyl-5-hydroxy-6-metoxy-1,4-benzoquinol methylase